MATELERHSIHAALYRPALFAGLPRPILIMEATMTLAFAFGLGFSWVTLVFVLVMLSVVHPFLVYLTRLDPDMLYVFMRFMGHKEYYDATPQLRAPKLPVRTSIPKV